MRQVHGFPKVMGVLTHLDQFRNAEALKRTKKALKHRFWTEIYQGAPCCNAVAARGLRCRHAVVLRMVCSLLLAPWTSMPSYITPTLTSWAIGCAGPHGP